MKGLVIALSKSAAAELTAGAAKFCDQVELIVIGDESAAVGTQKAYLLKCAGSRLTAAPYLAEIVDRLQPDMVLVEQNIDGRYFSAFIAAKLETSVLTDCIELTEADGKICGKRMTYGGKAIKTEHPCGKIVACVGSGVFEAACEDPCPNITEIVCDQSEDLTTLKLTAKEVRSVNLAAAKRVVGVGRGIGSEENICKARELAELIGAEIACTRPISEEERWLERERYIGVSGKMIKPQLYISLGISGQIQHTVGINGARTVICVNRDKNAPMFKQSDYGIVGDVNEVMPKLIELLK